MFPIVAFAQAALLVALDGKEGDGFGAFDQFADELGNGESAAADVVLGHCHEGICPSARRRPVGWRWRGVGGWRR